MNDYTPIKTLTESAYAAYGQATGFKNYQGLPMPAFAELSEAIRGAWFAAVRSVAVRVGVLVETYSFEGFGGPGTVVEMRDMPGNRWKIRLSDGSQPDFWAHDFEIIGVYLP